MGKRELVDFARTYSVDVLGLDIGDAFGKEGEDAANRRYAIYWSPRVGLKFCHKSFKNERDAKLEKEKLSLDYDVFSRTWNAYGGASDYMPVTRCFLRKSAKDIANAVPHEKWHDFIKKFDIPGNLMINEAVASALGVNSSISMTGQIYGKKSRQHMEAVAQRERKLAGSKLVNALVNDLINLYESEKPEVDVLREKKRILKGFNQSEKPVDLKVRNNADLADRYVYCALFPLADNVYRRYGPGSVVVFAVAMRKSRYEGFEAGVKELLKYYTGQDRECYRKTINVCRD